MKIEIIDLSKSKESIKKIGNIILKEPELYEFAQDTLAHEKEIENEEDFSDDERAAVEFFNNEKQFGIYIELTEENLMLLETEGEGEDKSEIRAKMVDGQGNRVRIVIKTRKGWVTVFLGLNYFELINELSNKSEDFIFVGGLTTKYKNTRTMQYEKTMQDGENYSELKSYTFNLWQLVQIIELKDGMDLTYHPKPSE